MSSVLKTAVLMGLLTAIFLWIGDLLGGQQGVVTAFIFAALMNLGTYWFSDKIALISYGAREVSATEEPRLHAIVERLCARAGLPRPRVYLLPSMQPNAFATGRGPHHAAVAATQGILQMLNDDELEGVLAHELAHVRHRDILIASVAATVAGAIGMLARMAQWSAILGDRSDRDRDGGGTIALFATAILAPVAALIIQLAISRSREFSADAGGAEIAGSPYGLARALQKLEAAAGTIPMPTATPATAHMFIVNPFSGKGIARLFSTHPPIEERVARLLAMPSHPGLAL